MEYLNVTVSGFFQGVGFGLAYLLFKFFHLI